MSSTTAWPLSETEASSADLVGPVSRRLAWWVDRPEQHGRFLNTLALMEHIGSRKIMVSQSRGSLSQETLKHLAEETRHAYFFKRAAETLARRELAFDDSDAIRPASAKMYFGRLDASIADALGEGGDGELPYLYVSMIIELRAIWMYRIYQRVLEERPRAGLSLKSVLAEENLHLQHMGERLQQLDPDFARRVSVFAQTEERLFRHLWTVLDQACEGLPQAA